MSIFGKIGHGVTGLIQRVLKLAVISVVFTALMFLLDATLSPDKPSQQRE